MIKRPFYALLLSTLVASSAVAATRTTTQAGNWSDTATWGGSAKPGNGDVAVIGHAVTVDEDTTVGTSAAAGTDAITASANLTVGDGFRLTVRGDTVLQNANLILGAGSGYRFDSSLAAGTPIYKIELGSASTQANNKLICNGTSGSRCTIDIAASSGRGIIGRYANSVNSHCGIECTYTDFTSIGNATTGFGTDAIDIQPKSSGQKFSLTYCTFTTCGRVFCTAAGASNDVTITNNRWLSATDTAYGLWVSASARSSGSIARTVTDNVHSLDTLSNWALVLETSVSGMTFSRNVMNRGQATGMGSGAFAECKNNLHYQRTSSSSVGTVIDTNGTTIDDCYAMSDTAAEGSGWWPNANNGAAGTITWSDFVDETSEPLERRDAWSNPIPANVTTYNINGYLGLPNSRGGSSGSITFHGTSRVTVNIDHNTLMGGGGSGSSNAQAGIFMGSTYPGHTGMLASVRSNLVWSKATPVDGGYIAWLTTSVWPKTGTASSGTTTTLTDGAASFSTTANMTLGSAAAKIVITGKTGSGPNVGEEAIISSNTATQVTFAPAMSAAPDTGTTYKISSVDPLSPATTNYNATYNMIDGTVYDSDGGSGSTKRAYHNFWLSAAIGANDISMTAGSDEETEGPQFVDSSRNFATFDTAYLANSASAWADATAYSVGDIRSAQTSTFYGNAVINYRCILAHTSSSGHATNGKPGSAATYRTNWEFASAYRIREAIIAGTTITDATLGLTSANYIATLHAWVRAGFKVQAPTLRNAGHDGETIGAMGFNDSGPTVLPQIIISCNDHFHLPSFLKAETFWSLSP